MFFVLALMLLIQIIIFAIAEGGCEEGSFTSGIANCGVSPGVYYIPLVFIMLSTLGLAISLTLLYCIVKEDDEDHEEKRNSKPLRNDIRAKS